MGLGRAVRRPAAPAPRPAAGPATAVVRQRDLPADDALKAALAVLQLASVPGGVRELTALVTAQHPRPERSWKWEHCRAYQQVLPLVVAAGKATAAAKAQARKQVRTIGNRG